jgi:hypothetical protein
MDYATAIRILSEPANGNPQQATQKMQAAKVVIGAAMSGDPVAINAISTSFPGMPLPEVAKNIGYSAPTPQTPPAPTAQQAQQQQVTAANKPPVQAQPADAMSAPRQTNYGAYNPSLQQGAPNPYGMSAPELTNYGAYNPSLQRGSQKLQDFAVQQAQQQAPQIAAQQAGQFAQLYNPDFSAAARPNTQFNLMQRGGVEDPNFSDKAVPGATSVAGPGLADKFAKLGETDFSSGPGQGGTPPAPQAGAPNTSGAFYGDPSFAGSWMQRTGMSDVGLQDLYSDFSNPQGDTAGLFMRPFLESEFGTPTAYGADTAFQMMQQYPQLYMMANPGAQPPSQAADMSMAGNFGVQMLTPGGTPVSPGAYWDQLMSPAGQGSDYWNPTAPGVKSADPTGNQITQVGTAVKALSPFMSKEQQQVINYQLDAAEAAYIDMQRRGDPSIQGMSFLDYLNSIGAQNWM